ncbi:hypothetical protein [Gluconobacter cerinus]|uniref:hypothetical protein n=1 Tax=Gluconobacter cerinus TaxID=38307 RepID=UPI000A5054D5
MQLDGSEDEKDEERLSRLVIACGNTPKLLQLIEHSLDMVAIPVTTEIAGNILFAI